MSGRLSLALWCFLKQELLHLYCFEDDWQAHTLAVYQFLDELALSSKDLLPYVGLQDPTRLYQALFLQDAAFSYGGI